MNLVLIMLGIYGLVAILLQPYLKRLRERETEATLQYYREFCVKRDAESPEMIGKWGKP